MSYLDILSDDHMLYFLLYCDSAKNIIGLFKRNPSFRNNKIRDDIIFHDMYKWKFYLK